MPFPAELHHGAGDLHVSSLLEECVEYGRK